MDKLKMETSDMAAENIEKIGALFPSAVTDVILYEEQKRDD